MNLTKAEKARLGAFVATGVLVLTGVIVWLVGMRFLEEFDTYTVRFAESVGGLEASAQVKYQGLRVGRVSKLRIAPDDPTLIEVTLTIDKGTVLLEGSTAVMDSNPLTGLKTINLTPGDPRAKAIPPGSMLPVGKSLFDRITGQAEAITVKVEQVTNQLTHWTSDENRIRLERTLEGLAQLTEHVDKLVVDAHQPLIKALKQFDQTGEALSGTAVATTKTLNEIRDDLHGTLAEARSTLHEVQRILAAVDGKKVGEAVVSANSAMKSLDKRLSSAELGEAITHLSKTLADVSRLLGEMELSVRASREDFVMSLKAIRQASEDLREFSRIIAQDPSVLIRGQEARQ